MLLRAANYHGKTGCREGLADALRVGSIVQPRFWMLSLILVAQGRVATDECTDLGAGQTERTVDWPVRNLILVLGDQLDSHSAAFDGFDAAADVVWMAEVSHEAEQVWSTQSRIAVFLSAMRHFRDRLQGDGLRVLYRQLDDPFNLGTFRAELVAAVQQGHPEKLIVVRPGEWRVLQELQSAADETGVQLEMREDRHFLSSPAAFDEHARGRKQLIMEGFYREMRRQTGVLMDGDQPAGGRWNYDSENRGRFGTGGPGPVPPPRAFPPDALTREVIELVGSHFPDHPGGLDHFDWAVTPEQARQALHDFIANRLRSFGPYQDAMWSNEPYLYHSRLSSALNLKLLDPREAIEAAEDAYRKERAPLNSVEGFIRQILGWREYVRGIYWHYMPAYATRNALEGHAPLPGFYWTGETDMQCLQQCIEQTLDYGYAHHIQRLMVTGLFALLLGVEPAEVHRWYLAVYVDAVEWVEMPNTLGMSQFADGGIMATKPYCASGKYIKRMSNYCANCRYNPAQRLGETACPFTTLYWEFLWRNRSRLQGNNRMRLQLRNVDRIDRDELKALGRQAESIRKRLSAKTYR